MMNEDSLKVVMLERGKDAYVTEIDGSLAGMQSVVGGLIEACYPFEEQVCIICNEEGKVQGLPLNRAIYDNDGSIIDVIAGPAFICDCSGEDFGSLSQSQLDRYRKKFRMPEMFFSLNGRILAVPVESKAFQMEEAGDYD